MDYEEWMLVQNDSFKVEEDDFSFLEIHPTPSNGFYYFFYQKENRLIKRFVLLEKERVDYICTVVLIKKDNKFSPRLAFSIRDKQRKISEENSEKPTKIKANVNLDDCYENFWRLIAFIQSLRDIEIPQGSFSLVSAEEGEIIRAIQGRDTKSIVRIIKGLSKTKGIFLSERDIAQILDRKGELSKFKTALSEHSTEENWWQDFFEKNKWIFGYGLNYQILREEQTQPHYGGDRIDGKGGQKGDYLTSTMGDINFTVLVEIKTPNTPLIQGTKEIRSGAWSLAKDLTDALSQIEANIDVWEKRGSTEPENIDKFERENIYTVQPKGIIVIGNLGILDTRSKRETFQRFRKSIHGIDILTFDELLKRAEFIVTEDSQKEEEEKAQAEVKPEAKTPDDIPF